MIRLATTYDRTKIIEMMLEFQDEIDGVLKVNNEPYWHKLLDSIFAGAGAIFYEENKGLLMSVVAPSMFCDKTLILHEIAWYVRPEFRNGTTGYRLLDAYTDLGNKLKEEGRIALFTVSKLVTSGHISYERLGYVKHHETWGH